MRILQRAWHALMVILTGMLDTHNPSCMTHEEIHHATHNPTHDDYTDEHH